MGWENAQLHEFEIGKRRYGEPSDEVWPGTERTFSENGVKLGDLINQGVTRFQYVYDFGDGWEHAVTIEKSGASRSGPALPVADHRQPRLPARGLRRRARLLPAARGAG